MGLDVVTLGMANAKTAKTLRTLRRRETRGLGALATPMTTPPTITNGAGGAATTIVGSTLIRPWETGAFTFTGTKPAFGGSAYPGSEVLTTNGATGLVGPYPSGKTSGSPWAAEFMFSTSDGKFEIRQFGKGSTGGVRVVVDGKYATVGPSAFGANDGAEYLSLVNLGAAGDYQIRLEFSGGTWFGGIRTLPANAVQAAPRRSQRWIVLGDSFTEPTVVDSGSWHPYDGWVQQLGLMLGVDAWSAGSGGTGYLNPGTGGRVKFRDRIADVTANSPDVIVVAGGINDALAYTATAIGTEAAALFTALRAAAPTAQLIVLSPFWAKGFQGYANNLLLSTDAIKTAALNAGGSFIDVLRLPVPDSGTDPTVTTTSTTLASAAAVNATTISTVAKIGAGSYMQIGSDANAEVRRVVSVSGTGPYTLNFSGTVPSGGGNNLGYAKTSGDTVTVVGQGILTGSGRQGTTTGDGNADRFTSSDSTHPTRDGHRNIAVNVYRLLMRQMQP